MNDMLLLLVFNLMDILLPMLLIIINYLFLNNINHLAMYFHYVHHVHIILYYIQLLYDYFYMMVIHHLFIILTINLN